jgi:KDO2-lipid IV(A) lauroyltransferase
MKPVKRFIKYSLIFLLLGLIVPIMLLVGIENSSKFFSWLAMKIGPKLKRHKVVLRNLELCFPDMPSDERSNLAIRTWSNLGAIFGEMLFFKLMSEKEFKKRITIKDDVGAFREGAKIIVISHLSNFEIFTNLPKLLKVIMHCLYSRPKNKIAEKLVFWLRDRPYLSLHANDGHNGLKAYINSLKNQEMIWMLVDRYPTKGHGIDTTFFSKPTKTASLPAQLSLKYNAPIFLGRVIRTGTARYEVKTDKMTIEATDSVETITQKINDAIESWVKEYPEQWYWILHRFDKSLY